MHPPATTTHAGDHQAAWRSAASRAIHPSICDGAEPLIASIARGLAAASAPWPDLAAEQSADRRYELLLTTDAYDAWLIHWPAGTGLDAHDHGGSVGAFSVVDGTLDEDTISAERTRTRRLSAGDTVRFGAHDVHAVVNRTRASATSVHVYSPPLRTMSFYEPDTDGALVATRVAEVTQ